MYIYCDNCQEKRDFEKVNLSDEIKIKLFVVITSWGYFSIPWLLAKLRIVKLGKAVRCQNCLVTFVICPHCKFMHAFNGEQIKKCSNCQKRFYTYV